MLVSCTYENRRRDVATGIKTWPVSSQSLNYGALRLPLLDAQPLASAPFLRKCVLDLPGENKKLEIGKILKATYIQKEPSQELW